MAGATLTPDHYEVQRTPIIYHMERIKGRYYELSREIGILATSLNCPIVIVEFFIGEAYGFSEELRNKIKRDMVYHNVQTIVGLEELLKNKA